MEQNETLGLLPYLDPRDRKDFAVSAGLHERKRAMDYAYWRSGHDKAMDPNPEWEAFQEAFPLLWQYALGVDNSLKGRRKRLSKRIALMLGQSTKGAILNRDGASLSVLDWLADEDNRALGLTFFCTLTFRPDVLASTTPETRKTYCARYLKATFGAYVANLDFGGKKGREHYHAVGFVPATDLEGLPPQFEVRLVQGDRLFLRAYSDFLAKPWADKCGYASLRLVDAKDSSRARLAKYLTKLVRHALKDTGQAPKVIYSRKPRYI